MKPEIFIVTLVVVALTVSLIVLAEEVAVKGGYDFEAKKFTINEKYIEGIANSVRLLLSIERVETIVRCGECGAVLPVKPRLDVDHRNAIHGAAMAIGNMLDNLMAAEEIYVVKTEPKREGMGDE